MARFRNFLFTLHDYIEEEEVRIHNSTLFRWKGRGSEDSEFHFVYVYVDAFGLRRCSRHALHKTPVCVDLVPSRGSTRQLSDSQRGPTAPGRPKLMIQMAYAPQKIENQNCARKCRKSSFEIVV